MLTEEQQVFSSEDHDSVLTEEQHFDEMFYHARICVVFEKNPIGCSPP